MKIAFFGDSLVAGVPGVSLYERLCAVLPDDELHNYGHGGDSVIGTYLRLKKMTLPSDFDAAFLWVGVNDVFVDLSWTYPMIRAVRNQPWTTNREEFGKYYHAIVQMLQRRAVQLFTVPPLFLGEDFRSPWQRELEAMARVIWSVSAQYENVGYIDLRARFEAELGSRPVSDYLPRQAFQIGMDTWQLRTADKIDERARERGLHFTVDGVHLNGAGADLVAAIFAEVIRL